MDEQQKTKSPSQKRSILQVSGLISLFTFFSRVFGLLRESIVSAVLGSSIYGDAFATAFRIPNLLRDLFAEGALSTSFQSVFSKDLETNGRTSAYALGGLVCGTLCFLVGMVVLLGEFFAPLLVSLLTPGYFAIHNKAEITIVASRIMMPFLLFVSLGAGFMGMLNAFERFTVPALAPILFNLSTVVVGAVLSTKKHPPSYLDLYWISISTLFGGLLQSLIQLIQLRRMGFAFSVWRIDWKFSDLRLRKILTMMIPSAIGLAALQVSIFITSSFTSKTDGAMRWIECAFRLMQLPIGLFGVAIGTVALSKLSKESVAGAEKKSSLGQNVLESSLRSVFFLAIPSALGLYVLANPIIEIIYQHKNFHAADTIQTAAALRAYTLGIIAYAGVKIMAPAFYAMGQTKFPMYATLIAVGVNVVCNVVFYPYFGYRALAFGTSVAAMSNFLFLLVIYQKKYTLNLGKPFVWFLLKLLVIATSMAAVVYGVHQLAQKFLLGESYHSLRLIGIVLIEIIVAWGVYGGLGLLFRIQESQEIKEKLVYWIKKHLSHS